MLRSYFVFPYTKRIEELERRSYVLISVLISLLLVNGVYFYRLPPAKEVSLEAKSTDSGSLRKDVDVIKKILGSLVPAVERLSAGGDKMVRVVSEKVNLRSEPGEKGKGIGTVNQGTSLIFISNEGLWTKVFSPLGGEAFIKTAEVEKL